MSLQPPNNLNLTEQATDPGLSPVPCQAVAFTNTKNTGRQTNEIHVSRSPWHKLCPEIISLVFEFYGYPPGWKEEWKDKFFGLAWNRSDCWEESPDCYPPDYFNSLGLLSQICRKWRDIVLSTPALWNKLYIIINPEDNPKIASPKIRHTTERLKRSGALPLTLFVVARHQLAGGSTTTGNNAQFDDLITKIKERSRRDLFFTGDCQVFSQICAKTPAQVSPLSTEEMMAVPTCKCSDTEFKESGRLNCFHTTISPKIVAPRGFGLSLGRMMAVPDPAKIITNISWLNVVQLAVDLPRARDCVCILKQAPQLFSLKIADFRSTLEPTPDHNILVDKTASAIPLVHDKVHWFKLSSPFEPYCDFYFFEMVAFPELRDLDVSISGPVNIRGLSRLGILQSFINRSRCYSLIRLILIGVDSLDQSLIEILIELHSLEVLHIGAEGELSKMREEVLLGPLLTFIVDARLLLNLRELSYLVYINPQNFYSDQHVEFIIFAEIRRRILATDNVDIERDTESCKLQHSFNLLANRDLIDKETVLHYNWGHVKNLDRIKLYPADFHNSDEFFMRSIEYHKIQISS